MGYCSSLPYVTSNPMPLLCFFFFSFLFAFFVLFLGLILLLVFCCRGCWGEVQRSDDVLWGHKARKKEHLVICTTLPGNCWDLEEWMALRYTAAQHNLFFIVLVLARKWLNWHYLRVRFSRSWFLTCTSRVGWCIYRAYHHVYLPCNMWRVTEIL